jgi:hypothetical protein
MSKVSTVKEVVKDTLVGHEDQPPESSSHYKAKFTKFARKDAETGELFLGPEEFVDAVAPSDEDFVGSFSLYSFCCYHLLATQAPKAVFPLWYT